MRYYNTHISEKDKALVTELHLVNKGLNAIPEIVFELPALVYLNLSKNKIHSLPKALINSSSLQKINLSENNFGLEADFGNLPSNVIELDLRNNKITVFPEKVIKLKKVSLLNLAENEIRKISAGIQKMELLRHLNLAGNKLTNLPAGIGKLQEIRYLNISSNYFRKLPKSIYNCLKISELLLNSNRLTSIDKKIGNCGELSILNLGNNKLKDLPATLHNCVTLRNLDLSNNKFKKIPSFIFEMKWLHSLNFSENELKIIDFTSPSPLLQLSILDLSKNKISGIKNIPKSLRQLILSHNNLTKFPDATLELKDLNSLFLSRNKIKTLPDDFKNLKHKLTTLTIDYNPVKCLPEFLLPLTKLKNLKGLLPVKKAAEFLLVLEQCRAMKLPTHLFAPFYQLTKGNKSVLDQLETADLIKALNLNVSKVSQIIRPYLYKKRGRPFHQNRLKKGSQVSILGTSFFDKKSLTERLASYGIQFNEALNAQTTHIVLGWNKIESGMEFQDAPLIWANNEVSFLSEKRLSYALEKLEKGHLSQEKKPEILKPIHQLLLHEDIANVELAIQLLKTGGCPQGILSTLFITWIKKNDEQLLKLLALHVEDDWKPEILMHSIKNHVGIITFEGERLKQLERFIRKNKMNEPAIKKALSMSE